MSLPDGTASAPPRSWWLRNWKWVVPVGCFSILALFAVFVASVVLIAFTVIRRTDVFREAIARAEANPQVRAELGEPIREGWWISGKVNTGPSGDADIAIPSTPWPTSRPDAGRTTPWRWRWRDGRRASRCWWERRPGDGQARG